MASSSCVVWLLALGLCCAALSSLVLSHSDAQAGHAVMAATAHVPLGRAMTEVSPSAPDSSIADEGRFAASMLRLLSCDSVPVPSLSYRRNIVRSPLVPRSRPSPSLRS